MVWGTDLGFAGASLAPLLRLCDVTGGGCDLEHQPAQRSGQLCHRTCCIFWWGVLQGSVCGGLWEGFRPL